MLTRASHRHENNRIVYSLTVRNAMPVFLFHLSLAQFFCYRSLSGFSLSLLLYFHSLQLDLRTVNECCASDECNRKFISAVNSRRMRKSEASFTVRSTTFSIPHSFIRSFVHYNFKSQPCNLIFFAFFILMRIEVNPKKGEEQKNTMN